MFEQQFVGNKKAPKSVQKLTCLWQIDVFVHKTTFYKRGNVHILGSPEERGKVKRAWVDTSGLSPANWIPFLLLSPTITPASETKAKDERKGEHKRNQIEAVRTTKSAISTGNPSNSSCFCFAYLQVNQINTCHFHWVKLWAKRKAHIIALLVNSHPPSGRRCHRSCVQLGPSDFIQYQVSFVKSTSRKSVSGTGHIMRTHARHSKRWLHLRAFAMNMHGQDCQNQASRSARTQPN